MLPVSNSYILNLHPEPQTQNLNPKAQIQIFNLGPQPQTSILNKTLKPKSKSLT